MIILHSRHLREAERAYRSTAADYPGSLEALAAKQRLANLRGR